MFPWECDRETHHPPGGQGLLLCLSALKLIGKYMERAVKDASDTEARHQMMFAALLAGISFGNSGVHLPHSMAYSVAGLVPSGFCPGGYSPPTGSKWEEGHLRGLVPHGMSVIVNAPSCFRFTAPTSPERHLAAARALGGDTRMAWNDDAAEALAETLVALMKTCDMPNGLSDIGYMAQDVPDLVKGAWPQQRLIKNAPVDVTEGDIRHMFEGALSYW